MNNLGTIVRVLRKRISLSQRNLALAAGITQASISRLEAGRQEATLETMLAIARGLELHPVLLLWLLLDGKEEFPTTYPIRPADFASAIGEWTRTHERHFHED